jgi:2-amino-4-hydroxy-6-hydroxymethyldihydropteridine diphosphokinase
MHIVYLSLGANLGNRQANLQRAINLLGKHVGTVVRQSSIHESKPWGFQSPNSFLNICVCCKTRLRPSQVLHRTQSIERHIGKRNIHATQRSKDGTTVYKDRPIDIDILLYDECRIQTTYLVIPHPHMSERPFVMEPLNEILV